MQYPNYPHRNSGQYSAPAAEASAVAVPTYSNWTDTQEPQSIVDLTNTGDHNNVVASPYNTDNLTYSVPANVNVVYEPMSSPCIMYEQPNHGEFSTAMSPSLREFEQSFQQQHQEQYQQQYQPRHHQMQQQQQHDSGAMIQHNYEPHAYHMPSQFTESADQADQGHSSIADSGFSSPGSPSSERANAGEFASPTNMPSYHPSVNVTSPAPSSFGQQSVYADNKSVEGNFA